MRKLFTAAAFVLLSTAAFAGDTKDWSDKENTCDNDTITEEMKEMAEQNPLGPRVIYVKDATEISRKSDELRCRITVVHSRGKQTGIFRFHNQDGHSLVGWKAGNGR
jgi:hypothetical protein